MKRYYREYRSLWKELRGLTILFHIVAVLVIVFLFGVALARDGYVSSAIPFLAIFIAVGLLAYARGPGRRW